MQRACGSPKLGSTRRVVALDSAGRYAGIVPVSAVYADTAPDGAIGRLIRQRDASRDPEMSIKEIMSAFDASESDELAVLDEDRHVLGIVSEAYATRRYAEELEKNRRDLVGGE